MDDLYHQHILDLYQNPPYFGELNDPDFTLTEANASCGDSFTFYIKLSSDKSSIEAVSYTGAGCAISTAATNLLIDHLIGMEISAIKKIDQKTMESLIGVTITPARTKCLMLPIKGLSKVKNS